MAPTHRRAWRIRPTPSRSGTRVAKRLGEGRMERVSQARPDDLFTTDTNGLLQASSPQLIRLADADRFDLRIGPVRKRVDDAELRMLGYKPERAFDLPLWTQGDSNPRPHGCQPLSPKRCAEQSLCRNEASAVPQVMRCDGRPQFTTSEPQSAFPSEQHPAGRVYASFGCAGLPTCVEGVRRAGRGRSHRERTTH
jgi:hypothetical protein